MTVVHVYGAYVPSRTEGISTNVHGLCQALARTGAHVRQDCVPTDLDRLNARRTLLASAWSAARWVRQAQRDPTVSLVHHHVSLVSTALPATVRRPARGAPVLVHAWNAHYAPGGARGLPRRDRLAHRVANGPEATRATLRRIEALVVSSRYQAAQVEALGYDGALHVVPNGVDLEEHRPRTPAEAAQAKAAFGFGDGPVLLYYGHATPWKGLRLLGAALPDVLRRAPDLQVLLSLTGYGGERQPLLAELARSGLAGRFRIVGPDHVARLHAAADLAVLPAPAGVGTACYPNVLLECLAGGVPLVATAAGCVPEVIDPGHTGLLARPGDPQDLAARLGDLATDPALRRRLATDARAAMVDGFGWDHAARRMLAVYRGLGVEMPAARPPRPRPSAAGRPVAHAPRQPLPEVREVGP